jgi:hypothetical protein
VENCGKDLSSTRKTESVTKAGLERAGVTRDKGSVKQRLGGELEGGGLMQPGLLTQMQMVVLRTWKCHRRRLWYRVKTRIVNCGDAHWALIQPGNV